MRTPTLLLCLLLLVTSAAFSQQALRTGESAPEFSGQSLDGKMYDLEQLHGKVVVLTFWSTRCQICHSEIPNLNRVAERYRDKDVVFLAVTMDNEAKISPYIKRNPFNFNILPNSFGVMLKYADKDRSGNINMGFPAHFLINRRGLIALRTDGWDKAANLDSQISRLLASD
ncbi:MAG TPA: TlpA disulfide reductase family protein [Pyrinomonadaceae bacterium]|nr:TlpA disulfide reductase family protein [Pyrinomonadaceae bacterium]